VVTGDSEACNATLGGRLELPLAPLKVSSSTLAGTD